MEIFKNLHYDLIAERVNVDEEEWIKDFGKTQYLMWVRPDDESYQTREPSNYSGPGSREEKESERNELEDGDKRRPRDRQQKEAEKWETFEKELQS